MKKTVTTLAAVFAVAILFLFTVNAEAAGVNTGEYKLRSLTAAIKEIKTSILARKNTTGRGAFDFYFAVKYRDKSYDSSKIQTTIKKRLFSHTGKIGEGDALKGNLSQIAFQTSAVKQGSYQYITVTVFGKYHTTEQQESKVVNWITKTVPTLYKKGASDYEKADAIYNWVIKNITYGQGVESGRNVFNSAYGARYGKATCAGISQLVYNMMAKAGVQCRIVRSLAHAWNIVKIEGKWYIVDATYGTCVRSRGTTINSVAYTNFFLKGTNNYRDAASRMTDWGGGSVKVNAKDYVGKTVNSGSVPKADYSDRAESYRQITVHAIVLVTAVTAAAIVTGIRRDEAEQKEQSSSAAMFRMAQMQTGRPKKRRRIQSR